MNTIQLETLSLISLLIFCIIGAFDGIYYHYHKYKLHLFEETQLEHYIHGVRGILFSPIALIFFVIDSGGGLLIIGLALLVADLILEVFDILVEKESRKNLGGISSGETLCHVFATGFRLLALGFMISTKPLPSYFKSMTTMGFVNLNSLALVGISFSVISLIGGVMHFLPKRRGDHSIVFFKRI